MALLYPAFDGLTSHQCELRLGFLRLSLAEQNTVILPQLHFFQISHLKKEECFVKTEQPAYWLRISIISTSVYSFLWLQLHGSCLFPKVNNYTFCAVFSKGPKVGLVRVYGRNHLHNKVMGCEVWVCSTLFAFVGSVSRIHRKQVKICSPLKRSTLSCTIKESRRESLQALPCYATEKLLDYTGIQP